MGSKEDLKGRRFGKLTVIGEEDIRWNKSVVWLCRCDCGNLTKARASHLKRGGVMSCGCYNREIITKHDESRTQLHQVWANMKDRCLNENYAYRETYGGRGITVCEEWQNSYEAFSEWAKSNGYEQGLTIDRIDNNGNYEPSNCRWVDMKTQCRNRRSNRILSLNGESHCVSEWGEILGVNPHTISTRLRRGWSVKDALLRPVV